MAKKHQLPRRSPTGLVEFYSTLQVLCMKQYDRAKLYSRIFWLRRRWQERVQELELLKVLNPTLSARAQQCWPCSLPEQRQWRCELKCCPFCFARNNAYVYSVITKVAAKHPACNVWFMRLVDEDPFKAEQDLTVEEAGDRLDEILRKQWNLRRRMKGTYGGVYRTLLLPQETANNAIKLQQGMIVLAHANWKPPIDNGRLITANKKGLMTAASYYFRYSYTWFDEDPRFVGYALAIQKKRQLQHFFGECKGIEV